MSANTLTHPPLLKVKQGLDAAYDRLNQLWKQAEELLVSMHVGEELDVFIDEEGEMDPYDPASGMSPEEVRVLNDQRATYWLGFRRQGTKWGVYYGTTAIYAGGPYDECTQWRHILECNKWERTAAAEKLAELISKATEAAERVRKEVDQAADAIATAITQATL